MYHGVGPASPGWLWNHLTTPVDVFEGQMSLLKERGWSTISLDELYAHMAFGRKLPGKPVVLTFDDGYLNNWVYAYPILKKYGHRAVIWISTDFVDPRDLVRPTLEDHWEGKAELEELSAPGFVSWEELKRMTGSGLIEAQSHAKTHTWYFSGPRVIDFHRPEEAGGYSAPPWLGWNMYPDRKFEYISAGLEKDIPLGTPIYEHGKSLVTRRYFEDEGLTARLVGHVSANGGAGFFLNRDWRQDLLEIVGDSPGGGRFETDQEYEGRVRAELVQSREEIETALGTEVKFLCWPGGGRNQRVIRIALEEGYLATTTHFNDPQRRNVYGQDKTEINRVGCGSPWVWHDKIFHRTDPGFFLAMLSDFAGNKKSIWIMRLYKLRYVFRCYLFGKC